MKESEEIVEAFSAEDVDVQMEIGEAEGQQSSFIIYYPDETFVPRPNGGC